MDVLALDKGPGMGDVERCFQDGYSTAGSAGTGLGAIQRLSTECDVYTVPARARRCWRGCRRTAATADHRASAFEIGGVCVPQRGETLCGDGFVVEQADGECRVLVADGLGHGPAAADCADAAVGAFREGRETSSPDRTDAGGARRAADDARARRWRSASSTLARRELRYAGVGNISGLDVAERRGRGICCRTPGSWGTKSGPFGNSRTNWGRMH